MNQRKQTKKGAPSEAIRAIRKRDLRGLKKCIKSGKPLNATDHDGWTALHYTVTHGLREFVEVLLNAPNCDVNSKASQGWTPLMMACEKQQPGNTTPESEVMGWILLQLLNHPDIDVNIADDNKMTALHYASYSCNITSVTWLLDRGALVNSPNLDHQTPLHVAVQSYPTQTKAHFEMKTMLAHVLIEYGANFLARCGPTRTSVLELCIAHGNEEIALWILNRIDPEDPEHNLLTPRGSNMLTTAATMGMILIVKALISIGVRPEISSLTDEKVLKNSQDPKISKCIELLQDTCIMPPNDNFTRVEVIQLVHDILSMQRWKSLQGLLERYDYILTIEYPVYDTLVTEFDYWTILGHVFFQKSKKLALSEDEHTDLIRVLHRRGAKIMFDDPNGAEFGVVPPLACVGTEPWKLKLAMELMPKKNISQMFQILKYGGTLWVFLEFVICGFIHPEGLFENDDWAAWAGFTTFYTDIILPRSDRRSRAHLTNILYTVFLRQSVLPMSTESLTRIETIIVMKQQESYVQHTRRFFKEVRKEAKVPKLKQLARSALRHHLSDNLQNLDQVLDHCGVSEDLIYYCKLNELREQTEKFLKKWSL